jgi:hypothetical protein
MNISLSVDDVMVFLGDLDALIRLSKEHFLLKIVSDPAATLGQYLGAMIGKYQFADGSQA